MKILTPSLLILGAFVLGGIMFKTLAPNRCATIIPNDTIFVLTGDVRRIPFAMRQLNKHPGTNLYIIGAGAQGAIKNNQKVIIESNSKSTYQNALAIKKIADIQGLTRLVLVTTQDHLNRARYLIKHELPDTEIVACPVPLNGMPAPKRLERWTTEYVKYLATILGMKES